MSRYQYHLLRDNEIRLLHLAPGALDDGLEATIEHVTLAGASQALIPRMSKDELKGRLPSGWKLWTTVEGRYLFDQLHEGEHGDTTWCHPDESIRPESYDIDITFPDSKESLGPRFEALSYVCGSGPDTEIIQVSDRAVKSDTHTPQTLPLRANLTKALRNLRRTDETRTLWVDALCINQSDTPERNHEVARMSSIYAAAWRVVVFLDCDKDEAESGLSLLHYLGSQVELSEDDYLLRAPGCVDRNVWNPWHTLLCDLDQWKAIDDLVKRQWWERLWTWQEVQLGGRRALLQCGATTSPWPIVRRGIVCIWINKMRSSVGSGNRLDSIAQIALNLASTTFTYTLGNTRATKTSDPRDKVYALLGLAAIASPEIASRIQPDYDLPVEKVYRQAFVAALEETRKYPLLRQCDMHTRRTPGPTWVPDLATFPRMLPGSFLAAGRSRGVFRFVGEDTLEAKGVVSGTLVSCHAENEEIDDSIACLRRLLSALCAWNPGDLESARYRTGESLTSSFVAVVLAGLTHDNMPEHQFPTNAQYWDAYRSLVDAIPNAEQPEGIAAQLPIHVLRTVCQRTLFQTDNKYLGLGPRGLRKGDKVVVLLGYARPIVLRPASHSTYTVVGECYVEGLMYSEALLGALPEGWKADMRRDIAQAGHLAPVFTDTNSSITGANDPRIKLEDNNKKLSPQEKHDLLVSTATRESTVFTTLSLV